MMSGGRGGTRTMELRVADLLQEIDEGRIVLPEFQRDFDWGDDRVAQLLATIIRRWPAGSLLLQSLPDETFYELREFDGGPPPVAKKVEYVVLDGQQRLTALYQAVYDTGDFVYAVRARALRKDVEIDEVEGAIQSFSRDEWDLKHRERAWTEEQDWIPFYSLRSPADFFAWRDHVIALGETDERDAGALTLSDAYRLGLEAFHTFLIPSVIVDAHLEMEAVARIFERVNRTGLKLGAFDLMVAKSFETGWNLRTRWEAAKDEREYLLHFFGEDGGMPVIRTIALAHGDSVREADVLKLNGAVVRKKWDVTIAAMDAALRFLSEDCGVVTSDLIPYDGMLITLAGVALHHDLQEHRPLLRGWFWSRAFGLRYEGGTNTTTVDEYHLLRRVIETKVKLPPVSIGRAVILEATKKRRSALWRAFVASLHAAGPRDPLTGDPISDEASSTHILKRESPQPGLESRHLLVLNLVLAERASARVIAGKGLRNCQEQIILRNLPADVPRVLASQHLPDLVRFDDINDFVGARADALEQFLISEIGYGFDSTESSV